MSNKMHIKKVTLSLEETQITEINQEVNLFELMDSHLTNEDVINYLIDRSLTSEEITSKLDPLYYDYPSSESTSLLALEITKRDDCVKELAHLYFKGLLDVDAILKEITRS